ncbi:hypothetical protein ABGK09_000150 [Escherichia coli]
MNNRVHQGHLARKRFGQNFLNDQFVIDSIVSAINPQKGQAMVEIGPGLAALTEPVGERLVPHATMPHPVKDVRVLSRITTEAFNQRRKTIRNSLGNLFSVEVLTGMGIDPAMRAENISVAQYCQMANYLAENAPFQES